jgi:DNA-binding MarR family transcriptional regulator
LRCARGWIRREVSPYDKRRFSLYITLKGERMLREVAQIIPRHERKYTSVLTEQERATLNGLLRKLILG